jgi:hypothetical protein
LKHAFLGAFIALGLLFTAALTVLAIAAAISEGTGHRSAFPLVQLTVAALAAVTFRLLYGRLFSARDAEKASWLAIPAVTALVVFWTVVLVRSDD